jgi:hypothetical protein
VVASAPARADSADSCYQSTTTRVYGDGNYVVNNNCTIVQQKQIAPYYADDRDDPPVVFYPPPYFGAVARPYYMPMRPMVRPFFIGGWRR